MSDQRRKPEHEHRRNPLTVRWTDQEHRLVVDEAWKRRISASELVRRLVIEGLGQRDDHAGSKRPEPALTRTDVPHGTLREG